MLDYFDITVQEFSLGQNAWCLFLYIVIVLLYYDTNVCSLKKWNNKSFRHTDSLLIFFIIFSLTYYTNHDYWNYYNTVKFGRLSIEGHLEPIYISIIKIACRNNLIFRFFVWGVGLIIFCIGSRIAKINTYHALYYLAACFIDIYSYGRVSVAMAVVFTGYIIIFNNYRKNNYFTLLGFAVFICAFFFHKSIVFAMVVSIAMTFIPISKKTIWILLICTPVLFVITKTGINYILETGLGLNEETASAALRYSGYIRPERNLMGKVQSLFDYGRFYIPVIIGIKMVYIKDREHLLPRLSINLFKIALGLQFFGSCFFFIGFDNSIFAYRILYMSMIPLVFAITDFYKYQVINHRQLKIIVWSGMIGSSYTLLYYVYKFIN